MGVEPDMAVVTGDDGIERVDVLVVGAGISGIGAGWHLQTMCPDKSYLILEGRDDLGGTWDLFRYPGIRSDSDMHTLGYSFRPWKQAKAIADGPSIKAYLRDTARDHGIDRHIRYGHKVVSADWSSASATWTVTVEIGAERVRRRFACRFLFMCSGYYRYDAGYTPDFAGREDFAGRIVHPQHWPEDLDYAGKRVIVIGSGATAVTLVPEMARTAGHVTMLQRSPTYMVTRPAEDRVANALRAVLPARLAYAITRWKNVLFGLYFYNKTRRDPQAVNKWVLDRVRAELPPGYDVETHFTPHYNVWDQRLCLVPDSDLFAAIRAGTASVETGRIDRFTKQGIRLEDGRELAADIIVTATGLNMQLLAGVTFTVDGSPRDIAQTVSYKAMMYSGIPNLASSFGYTNASWTLKSDLTCAYVCRLLNHMDRTGTQIATPVLDDPEVEAMPWLDFSSGYVQRAIAHLPRQGSKRPWRVHQNYALDLMDLRFGKVDDGAMTFTRKGEKLPAATRQLEPAE
ncbi:NAD(P)-binding domain-containing protein [Sphingomonas changnyeongensis]|uniref:NAD(P)-binding domain-containing protein n=1 Tax=Sphingomonas changnyeongensis TaxID=2698679 RepID=A0A7Z2NU59_9SPHN|nr:NAD(P)/FAD-dependent oxidoreductase [Sphingomonas changnyeongensis]QHL89657.1 NAD(P)-binding domain-containing protein [Sphingomonas changnyeongensis]